MSSILYPAFSTNGRQMWFGSAVEAALLCDAVVAVGIEQRSLSVLLLLRFDNIADIEQLVVPGIERDDLVRIVAEHVRDDATLHRRDDLLALRRERHDAELDRVAAGLLVIGDVLFDRRILFRDKALRPPHLSSGRRRVGDVGPRQGSGGDEPDGAEKYRTPGQIDHAHLPSPFMTRPNAGACWLCLPVV